MSISGIEGIVENGQIRLLNPITLPEQAKDYVVIPGSEPTNKATFFSPRLAHPEQAGDFAKQGIEGPANAQV